MGLLHTAASELFSIDLPWELGVLTAIWAPEAKPLMQTDFLLHQPLKASHTVLTLLFFYIHKQE